MLTQSALGEISRNNKAKLRLAYELDKSIDTIERWIKVNHPNLTWAKSLLIISEETGLRLESLIEEVAA